MWGDWLKGEVSGLISWPITQIPHRLKGNVPYYVVQGNGRKERKKCATGVSPACPGPSCYQPPPTVEHSHLHSWHCVPSRYVSAGWVMLWPLGSGTHPHHCRLEETEPFVVSAWQIKGRFKSTRAKKYRPSFLFIYKVLLPFKKIL